jgi:hypothetical protein
MLSGNEEGERLMALGRRDYLGDIASPLFWIIDDGSGNTSVTNGTMFFVDFEADGILGVTACHVFDTYMQCKKEGGVIACQVGRHNVDLEQRLVARNSKMDLATFAFSRQDLATLGKRAHRHGDDSGPLGLPLRDQELFFGGFPGVDRTRTSEFQFNFKLYFGGVYCHSATALEIKSQLQRENMVPLEEAGLPAENYPLGGLSGGPVFKLDYSAAGVTYSLAGVVVEGASGGNSGLELVRCRPAFYIRQNGEIDEALWEQNQPPM